MSLRRDAPKSRVAFSLVEMLTVLTVIAIVAALTLPFLGSISEGTNLTTGGQVLSDQVKLAAQLAASQNKVEEVRLIKFVQSSGSTPRYCAIQIWSTDSSGNSVSSSKVAWLPPNIAINESSVLSPLLTLPYIGSGTMSVGAVSNCSYVSFKVHPCGYFEPTPSANSNLYVTLVYSRLALAASLASTPNYAIVQINPYICSAFVYRP